MMGTILAALTYVLALGFGVFAIVHFVRAKKPLLRSMGLTFSRWLPIDIAVGLVITLIAMGLVFLVELMIGAITLAPGTLSFGTFFSDVLALLVPAAALEEFLFRVLLLSGVVILFSRLRSGRWIAVVIVAVVFGAIHLGNEGATAITAFGTGLGGLMYGIAFLATRSVWLPLGLHLGWNMWQGLFGFPISGNLLPGWFTAIPHGAEILNGGVYGPEGGLPGMVSRFVIIALVILYATRRWPGGSFATLTYAPDPEKHRPKHETVA
jgi:membrane protease YdiL (CAAX protease family)